MKKDKTQYLYETYMLSAPYKDTLQTKLPKSTLQVLEKNTKKYTEHILTELYSSTSIPFTDARFSEPRYLLAIGSAITAYSYTPKPYMLKLSIALLRHFFVCDERMQNFLYSTLQSLPFFTEGMLKTLALSFAVTDSTHPFKTFSKFMYFLDNALVERFENADTNEKTFDFLEVHGVLDITSCCYDIINILRTNYSVFFNKGFNTLGMYGKPHYRSIKEKGFVITCFYNRAFEQFNFLNNTILMNHVKEENLTAQEQAFIEHYTEQTKLTEEESKQYLLELAPSLENLFTVWEETLLGKIRLTMIGKALAIGYLQALGEEGYTFETWLS